MVMLPTWWLTLQKSIKGEPTDNDVKARETHDNNQTKAQLMFKVFKATLKKVCEGTNHGSKK